MSLKKLNGFALMSLILSSIIGAGLFDFPRQFAQSTNLLGLLLAWGLTSIGVVSLAVVFQTLAQSRVSTQESQWSEVQSAIKSAYGLFFASLISWGYWCSAWVGNLAYLRMLSENLLRGVMPDPSLCPWTRILLSSLILWSIFFLLSRGMRSFSNWNSALTIVKFSILFLTLGLLAFCASGSILIKNFTAVPSGASNLTLLWQVKNSMVYTAWLFLGFEGAVLIGHHAADRASVKKFLWLSLALVFALYLVLSGLVYASLPLKDLSALPESGSLSALVGKLYASARLSNLMGSVILLFAAGALLPWTLYAGTLAQQAAAEGLLPNWFKPTLQDGLPYRGILTSIGLTQFLLIVTYLAGINYDHLVSAATLAVVPSYFAAALQVSICAKGKKRAFGIMAVLYSLWLFLGESRCVYEQLIAIFGLGTSALCANLCFQKFKKSS